MSDIPHLANEESLWFVLSTQPDYCDIGGNVVPFDTFAILSTWDGSNVDSRIYSRGTAVFLEGHFAAGVMGNVGAGIQSGVSLSDGYVFMSNEE